jgi:hypothetical protein
MRQMEWIAFGRRVILQSLHNQTMTPYVFQPRNISLDQRRNSKCRGCFVYKHGVQILWSSTAAAHEFVPSRFTRCDSRTAGRSVPHISPWDAFVLPPVSTLRTHEPRKPTAKAKPPAGTQRVAKYPRFHKSFKSRKPEDLLNRTPTQSIGFDLTVRWVQSLVIASIRPQGRHAFARLP